MLSSVPVTWRTLRSPVMMSSHSARIFQKRCPRSVTGRFAKRCISSRLSCCPSKRASSTRPLPAPRSTAAIVRVFIVTFLKHRVRIRFLQRVRKFRRRPRGSIHFKYKTISLCHPERSEGSLSGERSFAALRMTLLNRLRLTHKTSYLKWIDHEGRPVRYLIRRQSPELFSLVISFSPSFLNSL